MTPLVLLAWLLAPAVDSYVRSIEEWRVERETRLKSDTGWLTVIGLFWLKEGVNTIGSADSADVVLPKSAPAIVGTITVQGPKVEFVAHEGVTTMFKDVSVSRLAFGDKEDVALEVGSISFYTIERGGRRAIRVKDRNAPARKAFSGLRWYPIDARWRVAAKLLPPKSPRTVKIGTIVGDSIDLESAGELVFTLDGREHRLEAVYETPERDVLFVMFKDRTNGTATYGAGRYMYPPVAVDGIVDLDFNKAYNPPCAFTDYATCPLPPRQNWLSVPVEAGEMAYKK
jgi:uncharacterized protein (DUF1684 family)